jgi:hypothetical protein
MHRIRAATLGRFGLRVGIMDAWSAFPFADVQYKVDWILVMVFILRFRLVTYGRSFEVARTVAASVLNRIAFFV